MAKRKYWIIVLIVLIISTLLTISFSALYITNFSGDLQQKIDDETSNSNILKGNVEYTEVTRGHNTGISNKSYFVISNSDSWRDLWYGADTTALELPVVDFNKEMIIAVFQGVKSSEGYTINVESIIETDNSLEINVVEKSPRDGCIVTMAITSPYQIVKIPKTNKEIKFTTLEEDSCN